MEATPTSLGTVGYTRVYRIRLTDLGLTSVGEIAILDDRRVSGGNGAASGFDLDFIKISTTLTEVASTAAGLTDLGYFSFTNEGTTIKPGYLTPASDTSGDRDSSQLYGTLAGSSNTGIDFRTATLSVRDSGYRDAYRAGVLSLGESGGVSFRLTQTVAAAGLFLYIGGSETSLSDPIVNAAPGLGHTLLPRGLTLVGTADADDFRLGQGFNLNAGTENDVINGLDGNDLISTGAGNDTITGGLGNDTIDGGDGYDTAVFGTAQRQTNISHNTDLSLTITSGEGTDTLSNVEALQFSDGTVDLLNGSQPKIGFVDSSRGISGIQSLDAAQTGGPGYLQWQYIYNGTSNMAFSTQASNAFIHGGSGTDALQAGAGTNILDGGLGSNFLTGGSGANTFFTDARGAGAVWNTIRNFRAGDAATLWGFGNPSSYRWEANIAGAAGSEGATLRANIVGGRGRVGDGIDASITFTGLSVAQAQRLQIVTGSVPAGNYLYIYNPGV